MLVDGREHVSCERIDFEGIPHCRVAATANKCLTASPALRLFVRARALAAGPLRTYYLDLPASRSCRTNDTPVHAWVHVYYDALLRRCAARRGGACRPRVQSICAFFPNAYAPSFPD